MPLVKSKYTSPWLFKNPHLHTLYPYFFRKVNGVKYVRQRIELCDGDFIDLDWSRVKGKTLVLLAHGLEGSSKQPYILGMARMLNQKNVDVVAINFRSCSGEINRLPRFYHIGDTEDLRFVVSWIEKNTNYESLSLIGHSLGANIILKYLGEEGNRRSSMLCKAITFSCPVDLASSCEKMSQGENFFYVMNFMYTLKNKLRHKIRSGIIKRSDIDCDLALNTNNFSVWDNCVTAPLHGFLSHLDYYEKASCYKYLNRINIPCLMVNSLDDPFLSNSCFPYEIAERNTFFYLETTENGGHAGFIPSIGDTTSLLQNTQEDFYWSECRAFEFLQQNL
ncbi:MAG: alpha/beta fold hydrolase [Bdellovibrio sp.]|nr:alpha/beta fold hydrolase [Bdellovibrio sp.]